MNSTGLGRIAPSIGASSRETASTHFDYTGPPTECCLMGSVALRARMKRDFDWKNMKVTHAPEANEFIRPDYREGRTIS